MKEYAQSQWLQEYAAAINVANPTDAFFTYLVFVMVFPIAMYAIMATLRMRADEAEGTAEMILTTSVNRGRWAASHLAFGIGAPVILLVILGFGFGLGSGIQSGDLSGNIARMLRLTISLVPAVWVIVGITMAAIGLLGRGSTVIGWTALAVGILTEIIVKMKLLPEWLFLVLSPFAHVNPYFRPSAITFVGLTLLAAVLVTLGFYGLKRRDLTN
jgi:ABC-2 type transport system permease protein